MPAQDANTLLASAFILTITTFSNTGAEDKGCLQNETLTDLHQVSLGILKAVTSKGDVIALSRDKGWGWAAI